MPESFSPAHQVGSGARAETASDACLWTPPTPRELVELRQRMEEYQRAEEARIPLATAISLGQNSVNPLVAGAANPDLASAAVLGAQEAERLADARLYLVDAKTTAAAVAAAATPPEEVITADRPVSPNGLMVFQTPIGTYPMNNPFSGSPLRAPIVAVSWGLWQADPADSRVRWSTNTVGGTLLLPPGFRGIWLTFYTDCTAAFRAMDPGTLVLDSSGQPTTAGALVRELSAPGSPRLVWDNETIMPLGLPFPPAGTPTGTTGMWTRTVYRLWELMTRDGSEAQVETAVVQRDRAERKRDRRAGITGDGDVRVGTYRPRTPAVDTEADHQPTAARRTASTPEERWTVPPYRQNKCLNPRAHATGGCTHADVTVTKHVNGPKGRPVRVSRGPVNLVKLPAHPPR
ncbi:hypothetical protein BIV57_13445 [Mangrovactinospora gilvigrisea]|uniref:Uncharacterized protein n=1 Tax=Mangrovactinospora gilvigrisea TaxID=1428644 RepID=A0A1J7BE81_9ACTN|nr:hypothetical protein [Mangrovactinospora gilvigrisea]OIV36987.1 hypothetical protein BIV57_13445 [Mangrovactinospora gilvigrisea]